MTSLNEKYLAALPIENNTKAPFVECGYGLVDGAMVLFFGTTYRIRLGSEPLIAAPDHHFAPRHTRIIDAALAAQCNGNRVLLWVGLVPS